MTFEAPRPASSPSLPDAELTHAGRHSLSGHPLTGAMTKGVPVGVKGGRRQSRSALMGGAIVCQMLKARGGVAGGVIT
jgi:hypothetical protein